jgi:lysozyme
MQTISQVGIAEIKRHELCRLEAYPDRGGVLTIGWGDTIGVKKGDVITQVQADERLQRRLAEHETQLRAHLTSVATQSQFDALLSLSYNIGAEALRTSTLLRLFNEGKPVEAAKQFARWVHVKGQLDANLMQRRVDELCRFFALG